MPLTLPLGAYKSVHLWEEANTHQRKNKKAAHKPDSLFIL